MGNTVIDSRDDNPIAAALQFWLKSQEQAKAERKYKEEQARLIKDADLERRLDAVKLQLQQMHPTQRSAYIGGLAPEVRSYFVDPATLPKPEYTPNEQAERLYGQKKLEAAQGWQPNQFSVNYMNMEGVLGRNPNASWTNAERDRAFMTPEDFTEYVSEGFVAPSEADKNRAAAAKDKADAAFTSGPRTSTEYAQGTKYGAETGKIREETITERELRDPNSPASRAKNSAGGRKTSAQQAVESVNSELTKLSAKETKLLAEIAGERAGLQASGEKPSPFLKKKEAELAQTRASIKERMDRRDKITDAAQRNGVQTQPKQPAAYAPDIERRIEAAVKAGFSRDAAIQRLKDSGVIRD